MAKQESNFLQLQSFIQFISILESNAFPQSYEEEDMDHLPPLPIGHN